MSLLLLPLLALPAAAAGREAVLCAAGRPALPVLVAPGSVPAVRRAAEGVADVLGRICGGPFALRDGVGRGVSLGLDPALPLEGYSLRTEDGGAVLRGGSPRALETAAAELLHRAGYRRFFPGPHWEVVPSRPDLSVSADVSREPSFATRSIWYSDAAAPGDRAALGEWKRRNGLIGPTLDTGHSYEETLRRHKAVFDAHPEYLGLENGRRSTTKFCLSNPAVRRLLAEDAVERAARAPAGDAATVSVEPSDGDGWCECAACRAMGTPSDRVLAAANEAARALAARVPGVSAAFYAYNMHAAPPSGRAEPNVVVTVATEFLPRGLDPEGLIRAWADRGVSRLGVREYFGIVDWHFDLPGRMRGADLGYLARTIPRYHALGARFYSAESGQDWGPNGLGCYVAGRLLNDVEEARRVDAIREDFLRASFGPAAGPMRRFYALIDGSRGLSKTEVPPGLVGEMYALLGEAADANRDPAAGTRLDDLVLYTRYVELFAAYRGVRAGRAEAFDALARHVLRMRPRLMLHTDALLELLARKEKRELPSVPEGDYSPAEAAAILRAGRGT